MFEEDEVRQEEVGDQGGAVRKETTFLVFRVLNP